MSQPGWIYRSGSRYRFAMRLLYGRRLDARYRLIANLIPAGASVLDLCCGPPVLFHQYLRPKSVRYLGLDLNPRFIAEVVQGGGDGEVWDLGSATALPAADCVLMQGSLYHFLPHAETIVRRMFVASRQRVIIAEPIRNLADSRMPIVRWLSSHLTDPGAGAKPHRFTERTLDDLLSSYGLMLTVSFLIPGGREKVYLFEVGQTNPSIPLLSRRRRHRRSFIVRDVGGFVAKNTEATFDGLRSGTRRIMRVGFFLAIVLLFVRARFVQRHGATGSARQSVVGEEERDPNGHALSAGTSATSLGARGINDRRS
jgi:Methionine biosynthesis protein MetW